MSHFHKFSNANAEKANAQIHKVPADKVVVRVSVARQPRAGDVRECAFHFYPVSKCGGEYELVTARWTAWRAIVI